MNNNKRIRTPREIERLFAVLRIAIAIVIALLFAFLMILLISKDPGESIYSFICGPFTTKRRMGEIISKFIPLLFTGCGVCFIFSANQTNMAVEGGFTVGALGATIAAVYFHIGSSVVHIFVALMMGGIFGMIAAFIPAFMYVKFNSKPIVSSLMVNYICMYIAVGLINHSMRDNSAGYNASAKFDATAVLPNIWKGTTVHLGLVLGILLVIFSYYYLYRSQHGYEIRTVGNNMDFARYSGMPIRRILMNSQLIGGFIAGLGGAVEILGMYNRFQYASNTGLGFDGIMVGIMAAYNPKFVPLAAIFYAYVKEGAAILARSSDIPVELVSIIQAIIIMMVVAERFLYKQKHNMMVKAAEERLALQESGSGRSEKNG